MFQPTSLEKKKISWKHVIGSTLAYWYTMFLGWTTKIYWFKSEEALKFDREGQNYIFGVWHNQQLFLLYPYRGQKICALISLSDDGEYIARCLPHFGMKAVRGSTTRGGARALIKLKNIAEAGYHPMLTPDGPRGPIYKVQHGILFLALKTGLPIIPVGTALSHKIKVGSWDKMRVPLPFGKTALTYGKAVYVRSDAEMEAAAAELEKQLNWATDQSERFINKKPFDTQNP
ncbi:lysophospholipid acyltransferase family protein [Candidatus Avelusimicrobium fimicolum]|uniref:lysophospholipid acyltransferase family protein n=1 Tax=Candidatus Avelusimicrobium fimicolum TaxID=3416216 RepID=UPI003D0D6CF4